MLTDVWLPHYVNFVTDPTRKGNTFTLVTTELKREAQVVFTNDESAFPATYAPGNNLIHAFIGSNFKSERLVVNGTDIYPGTMYLQYYVWSESRITVVSELIILMFQRVTCYQLLQSQLP